MVMRRLEEIDHNVFCPTRQSAIFIGIFCIKGCKSDTSDSGAFDLNIFRSREARNNYLFCFMSIIATSPAIINACNESTIFFEDLTTAHCQPSLWRRTIHAEQKILSNERPKSLITAHKNMVSLLKILISLTHVHLNSCSSLSVDDCSWCGEWIVQKKKLSIITITLHNLIVFLLILVFIYAPC